MSRSKQLLRSVFNRCGYEIQRVPRTLAPAQVSVGHDPYQDMRRLTETIARPMFFDVGANVGQSVDRIRTYFDHPVIHSFEPSPETFVRLQEAAWNIADVTLNNIALGRKSGTAELVENTDPALSSLLEPGPDIWGSMKRKTTITVSTLDEYCTQNSIGHIDVLKLDTQGFELDVLHGAETLFSEGRVGAVFMEITLSEMYKGLPRLDELYRFMIERGFVLVAFYDFHYQKNRLGWCDALFARRAEG
jgi:FkbM family methyltransferase